MLIRTTIFSTLLFVILLSFESYACHLSGISLVSGPNVVADQNGDGDTDYSITINLCIGCGTAGVDATQDFWFTFTGAGSVISVSPTTIDFGGDVANGSISGQTVFFDVCNTNSCDICANGNNNQVCTNITFIVDDYPSNLTVYGLEEQCDGMGGCNSGGDYCVNDYPNTDNTPETITFTLPLTLNFFRAKEVGKTNVIELNILTASNIKNLVLQKLVKVENSGEHTHGEKESGFHFDMWKTLSVTPVPDGNIDGKTMTFVDENPAPVNYYRVLYEEFDGVINTTPVVYVGNKSVEQSLLNVLPNPVLDEVQIQVPINKGETVEYEIYTISGQLIEKGQSVYDEDVLVGSKFMKLNTSSYKSGTYYVSLVSESKNMTARFVKI